MSYTRGGPTDEPCQYARQLPAVPLGQVSLGHANLLFDEIEVIEQPFPAGVIRRFAFTASANRSRTPIRTPSFSASLLSNWSGRLAQAQPV